MIDHDYALGLLEHDPVIKDGLPVITEWLVIFIPGPKSGLNLVAFHIYSWTSIWIIVDYDRAVP